MAHAKNLHIFLTPPVNPSANPIILPSKYVPNPSTSHLSTATTPDRASLLYPFPYTPTLHTNPRIILLCQVMSSLQSNLSRISLSHSAKTQNPYSGLQYSSVPSRSHFLLLPSSPPPVLPPWPLRTRTHYAPFSGRLTQPSPSPEGKTPHAFKSSLECHFLNDTYS